MRRSFPNKADSGKWISAGSSFLRPRIQTGNNTHLNPLALHLIKLEEILQVHPQVSIDAKPTEPPPPSLSFGVRMPGAIGRWAYEQSAELPRRVFHFARDPVARPSLPSLQLFRCFRGRRRMMMRAPMARSPKLQVQFLPQIMVY
jgi:hypothetical protein